MDKLLDEEGNISRNAIPIWSFVGMERLYQYFTGAYTTANEIE
jgi:hypothetical protein